MKEAMKMLSALKDPALFVGCSFETSEGLQVLPDGERMWASEVTVKKNGKVLQRMSKMVPKADFDPSKERLSDWVAFDVIVQMMQIAVRKMEQDQENKA